MISGLILTFGTLLIILVLLISYYSQNRINGIQNKLFQYLLINGFVLTITEIIAVSGILYLNNVIWIYILYRIHWATGITIFFLFYCYFTVYIGNIEANSIKDLIFKDKRYLSVFILYIGLFLIYLVVPFSQITYANLYLPGMACYFVFFTSFISINLNFAYLLKHKDKMTKDKLNYVLLMVTILVAVLVLQLVFPYVAFPPIGVVIELLYLYFKIENPDLIVAKELEKVNAEIERSNQAKTDFLSNMSHEIRSPMNAIVGLSDGLIHNTDFEEEAVRQDIKHISSAGKSLLEIINNILDISKIESGKEVLDMKEYSLGDVISDLSTIIKTRLMDLPVQFILDIDPEIPASLYGDSTKIFQILLNILTNAVKYTEVGKIKLSIHSSPRGEMVDLHIKVSDTGFGIKKEDYDKLFEKFSRLDSATKNEIEGTGLGLVITKKYVDLMGGKIWFESEYHVGTTFYVELSQKILSHNTLGVIEESSSHKEKLYHMNCQGKKALIIDDNQMNSKVTKRLLENYHFDVEIVESANDCIYKIKEGNEYDIIFLDYIMPEMDGVNVLHVLKKLEDYSIPPVVCLTANAIVGMREIYLKEGFDEFLSKPINEVSLDKIIHKFFG